MGKSLIAFGDQHHEITSFDMCLGQKEFALVGYQNLSPMAGELGWKFL